MNDSTIPANADALAREWMEVATRARARHVRRVLGYSALVLVMLLGSAQLGSILLWAARTATWWALAPVLVHVLAMALALGLPAHAGASILSRVPGFKGHVAARLTDRVARLHLLRTAVMLEAALLFSWPLARLVALGETPRWGVTFTTAVCTLAILWPLQRIARAQRAESERLLSVDDRDTR
jgi:hypothetical protein